MTSSTAHAERRRIARALAWGVATLIVVGAPRASASPESEGLFEDGKRAMDAGRIEEACAAFERSFDLAPLGGTLLAMAICHEKQGRLATAMDEYRRAAEVARTSDRDDRVAHATGAMEALRTRVPHVVIDVPTGAPADLAVRLDGRSLDAGELGTPIAVDPGAHRVDWSGTDVVAEGAAVDVKERTTARVVVAWRRAPEPAADEDLEEWDTKSSVAVALGASGVAAFGVGGVLGALALGKKGESDDACDLAGDPARCSPRGASAYEDGQRLALGADIAFLAGTVLVGSAIAVYLWPVEDETASRVRVRGVAGASGAFVTLEGAVR